MNEDQKSNRLTSVFNSAPKSENELKERTDYFNLKSKSTWLISSGFSQFKNVYTVKRCNIPNGCQNAARRPGWRLSFPRKLCIITLRFDYIFSISTV